MGGSVDDFEADFKDVDGIPRLGERKKRRRIGTLGVKKEKETDPLLEHVGTMVP